MTRAFLAALILSLSLCAQGLAQSPTVCKVCQKLKTAEFIGVKSVKQYLSRSQDLTQYSSEKKAKKAGLTRFAGCAQGAAKKRTGPPCKPAFGIPAEGIYFCPNQLKPFATEAKAQAKNYSAYDACGAGVPTVTPTPTATPQITPHPSDLNFVAEAGDRMTDVDALSVARLPGGTYRSYLSPSESPFDPDTLKFSDSADGLTFGAKTSIIGIVPEALETFANPAFLALSDGSFVIIYEEIKHISSAAVNISNLMRASSADGTAFSLSPAFTIIPGGSSLANLFRASLVPIGGSSLRMYYRTSTALEVANSTDLGASFAAAEQVAVLGRSDSLAPYVEEPSVVRLDSGRYLIFFTSSPIDSGPASIFYGDSSDGNTFYLFNQALVSGSGSTAYTAPEAVVLPDGSIRLYFVERVGSFPTMTRTVKSLIAAP